MLGIMNEHLGQVLMGGLLNVVLEAKTVASVLPHSFQQESSQPHALLVGWPACEHPPPLSRFLLHACTARSQCSQEGLGFTVCPLQGK